MRSAVLPLPLLLLLVPLTSPLCAEAPNQGDAQTQTCLASSTTLCLQDNRFEVTVSWKDSQGTAEIGQALPLTRDAGLFWFFSADNVELLVKVLDGREVNGAFWVFYGALSDVAYTIQVKDLSTGAVKSYLNPAGTLASKADTQAFPTTAADLLAAAAGDSLPEGFAPHLDREAFPAEPSKADLVANFAFFPLRFGEFEITFFDTSSGEPDAWCWRFGDSSSASCDVTSPTAVWSYGGPGIYVVTLEVRRFDGQSVSVSQVAKTVVVSAGGGPTCTFSVSPRTDSFKADGGTGTLTIAASSGCSWSVVSKSSFLTIQSGASGSGNGTARYSVQANTGDQARSGTLQFTGHYSDSSSVVTTIAVTQTGKSCATLNIKSADYSAAGGGGEIQVDAPKSCRWTAASNSSFLTVTAGASGKGDGTVKYSVQSNPGHTSRTGTLTVADQTFTAKQEGVPCTYTVTPATADFEALGGSGTVSISTDSDCSWQATADDGFLALAGGTAGKGNGAVQYCVAANRGDARSGSLHVGGQNVAIEQSSPAVAPSGCGADPEALCLLDRFAVRVTFYSDQNRSGMAVPLTPNTGYFYFFDPANVELVGKVLDGRSLNSAYWLFYGSASDLAYAVTLYDTTTGASKLYCNPRGTLKSVADTNALPGE